MADKLPLKDVLGACDLGAHTLWDELTDAQRKSIGFWLLNRYMSNVKGDREKQELAVFKTNEYFNKNYMVVSKHPKLQFQLACLSGNTGRAEFHPYLNFKSDKLGAEKTKFVKVLAQVYPTHKQDELEMLANMSTKEDIKQLAEDHGIETKL